MANWRYVLADLLTDQDIGTVELSGVNFDRRIIEPGTFKATAAIPNARRAAQVKKIVEGRTVVHVYRDADIWGSFIIWGVTPKDDGKGLSASITGASLESWLWHRVVAVDRTFTQVDQIEIARTLIEDVQAGYPPFEVNADIGLLLASGESGMPRDRTYRLSEMTSVGQRLTELANAEQGFEWILRSWVDMASGQRIRLWDWAAELGGSATPWSFSQPGRVLSWEYPRSAVESGTGHWARGDTPQVDVTGDAEPLLVGPYAATDMLAAGWPWLDVSSDHQGVLREDTLEAYALRSLATRAGSIGIPIVTVSLPERGGFSPNSIGDYARLTLVNDWWPLDEERRPTFDHLWRIVGMEVTPGEGADAGNDKAKLIFAEGV